MSQQLKICLVGGIYGKDQGYRAYAQITPETTLEQGLRERGHAVATFSHYQEIDYQHFDVVHVHHLGLGALRAACSRSGTPLAFTLHDLRVMQGSLSRVRGRALRFVVTRADAVVALSNIEKQFLRARYRIPQVPVVIPNGIDSRLFSFRPKTRRRRGDRWRLLYVGQLIALKRVDLLLQVMAMLPQDVDLFLAYHNAQLEGELKAQAQALGVSGRIEFLGARSAPELAELYHQSDLFVLPSSGEALPSVVAEAMFCGTPVVATEVGGIPEQVGDFGITVPPGDARALAEAIGQVLGHYEDFAARAEAMSEFARGRASRAAMIDQHIAMYSELAARKATVRGRLRRRWSIDSLARMGVNSICRMKCANSSPRTPGRRRPSGDISS
jgi:glycosyltransferase involved in cell wall biosynthesis